jgi:hypothetical protein
LNLLKPPRDAGRFFRTGNARNLLRPTRNQVSRYMRDKHHNRWLRRCDARKSRVL